MPEVKVLILATDGCNTRMLCKAISQRHTLCSIIIEQPISKQKFLKNRLKKIGVFKVIGQIMFMSLVLPFISSKRNKKLVEESGLDEKTIPTSIATNVASVNDKKIPELIASSNCNLVVINGTRIIKESILSQIKVPIVNIHVGITPEFRGVHGGYWAKFYHKSDLFGVTVHYVDAGIDTGDFIAQKTISTTKQDNFKSYPTLQYLAGIELLLEHMDAIIKKETKLTKELTSKSQLHYHPGFFQYLNKRIFKGVK